MFSDLINRIRVSKAEGVISVNNIGRFESLKICFPSKNEEGLSMLTKSLKRNNETDFEFFMRKLFFLSCANVIFLLKS